MQSSLKTATTIVGILFILGLISFVIFITVSGSGARGYLEKHYAEVHDVTYNPITIRCMLGKDRRDYSFTATTKDGRKVNGYICYTMGGFLPPPKIHEGGR